MTKTSVDQEIMQIGQRIHGHPRTAQAKRFANVTIQHPCGDHNDFAMAHDNVRDPAVRPFLGILASNGPLEIRMPSIPNDNVAPDMGRMFAR